MKDKTFIKDKRQSSLSEYVKEKKPFFHKSLLTIKKNNIFHKLYYFLINFRVFYSFKKLIKYSFLTLISNIFDFGLLYIFTDLLNVYYLFSAVISYLVAIFINYLLNREYTFKYTPKNFKLALKSFVSYISVSVSGMIFTIGLMGLFVELLGINYLIAKLIASILIFFYVYFGHSFIFANRKVLGRK